VRDIGTDVLVKWRVVPEEVVAFSVFPSACCLARTIGCSGFHFP